MIYPKSDWEMISVMNVMDRIALALVIIGGINWGLVGVFGLDLVASLCGGGDVILARVIYTLFALGGIWSVGLLFRGDASAQ